MPKFLEKKLKERYGKDSDIPYKIMNAKGFMHGSKETAKGKEAEKKHKRHKKESSYEPSGLIKGLGGEGKKAKKSESKKPSFASMLSK